MYHAPLNPGEKRDIKAYREEDNLFIIIPSWDWEGIYTPVFVRNDVAAKM